MRKIKSVLCIVFIFCSASPAGANAPICREAFVAKATLDSSLQSSKRKVGLELEFGNADYTEVLEAIALLTKGKIVGKGNLEFDQKSRPIVDMDKLPTGEHHGFSFSMRTVDEIIVSGRYHPSFDRLYIENHILSAQNTFEALKKVHGIFAGRIPFIDSFSTIEGSSIGRIKLIRDGHYFELITQPLELSQLKYFTEVYEMLITMGAEGVERGHAVGLHINVSVGYAEAKLLKDLVLTWTKNLKVLRTLFNPAEIRSSSYGPFEGQLIAGLNAARDPSLIEMAVMFDKLYAKGLDLNVATVLNKKRPAAEVRLADADFTPAAPRKAEQLIRSTVDFVDKVEKLGVFEIQ